MFILWVKMDQTFSVSNQNLNIGFKVVKWDRSFVVVPFLR